MVMQIIVACEDVNKFYPMEGKLSSVDKPVLHPVCKFNIPIL